MGNINEGFKTANATIRTALATLAVCGAGLAGYKTYDLYNKPHKQLQAKQAELEQVLGTLNLAKAELKSSREQVDRLQTSLHLLKIDQRVAELRVLEQTPGKEQGDPAMTTVEFVETDPEGKQIGKPRKFVVPGDQVYLEYLVVKFNDQYVEQADLERGTAICLFRRMFGNAQKPEEGFQIDSPNTRPTAYARGEKMSEFEKSIWTDFWDLAHDPARLAAMGIRSAMSEAPSIKARPGVTYRLQIRATGGFHLEPISSDDE